MSEGIYGSDMSDEDINDVLASGCGSPDTVRMIAQEALRARRRERELEAALKNAGEVICGEYCLNIRKALDGGKEG